MIRIRRNENTTSVPPLFSGFCYDIFQKREGDPLYIFPCAWKVKQKGTPL